MSTMSEAERVMESVTVVVAGTYVQFAEWCAENGVQKDSGEVIYVTGAESLRGLRPEDVREVVRVGTWAEQRDTDEIEARLRERGL